MWMMSLRSGRGGGRGGKRRMPPAIQMSVMCSASEGAETMKVTVGDGDSWSSRHSRPPAREGPMHRPQRVNGENVAEEIKAPSPHESKQHSQKP